jgi:rfaE bifunctional protein nucleotidyltransferase chain/domain
VTAVTSAKDKIVDLPALLERLAQLRARGEKIVFTNGCFDLVHVGHLRYLQAARRLGDRLVVAINSDGSMRKLKGPGRPILPLDQRLKVLAGFGCVDFVLAFEEDTPHTLLRGDPPRGAGQGGELFAGRRRGPRNRGDLRRRGQDSGADGESLDDEPGGADSRFAGLTAGGFVGKSERLQPADAVGAFFNSSGCIGDQA